MSPATRPEDDKILKVVRERLPIYRWELQHVVRASDIMGCDISTDTLARLNEAYPRAPSCEVKSFAQRATVYMDAATKFKTSFPISLLFPDAHDLRGERLIGSRKGMDSERLVDIEKQAAKLLSSLQKLSVPLTVRLWVHAIPGAEIGATAAAFEGTLVSLARAAATVAERYKVDGAHRPPIWQSNPLLFVNLLDVACAWKDAKLGRRYAISEKDGSAFRAVGSAFLGTDLGRAPVTLIRGMMEVPPHNREARIFARAARNLYPAEAVHGDMAAGAREGRPGDSEAKSTIGPDRPEGVPARTFPRR